MSCGGGDILCHVVGGDILCHVVGYNYYPNHMTRDMTISRSHKTIMYELM